MMLRRLHPRALESKMVNPTSQRGMHVQKKLHPYSPRMTPLVLLSLTSSCGALSAMP